ncbi:signal peptidase II [Glycomyces halotolerans]
MQTAGGTTLSEDTHSDTAEADAQEQEDRTPSPDDRTPKRRPGLMLACYLIAAAAIGLDQITKALAVERLDPDEPIRILGGLVYLSLTWNPGAAFSIATDYTWILAIIATCVVAFLIVLARKIVYPAWAVAIGLVLGGAAGNLVDRVLREPSDPSTWFDGGLRHFFTESGIGTGHVVDFISVFQPHGQAFPIFNLADSSLVCGVALIILLELTGRGFSPAARGHTTEEGER